MRMPATATKRRKRVRMRKFQMALVGGKRARALFHVMPVPLGSSIAGVEGFSPSGCAALTLALRCRTVVASATVEERWDSRESCRGLGVGWR
jgi:hypothetical protein